MLLFCISIKIDHIKIFDLKPKTTNNLQQNSQYILLQYETVKHIFFVKKGYTYSICCFCHKCFVFVVIIVNIATHLLALSEKLCKKWGRKKGNLKKQSICYSKHFQLVVCYFFLIEDFFLPFHKHKWFMPGRYYMLWQHPFFKFLLLHTNYGFLYLHICSFGATITAITTTTTTTINKTTIRISFSQQLDVASLLF